MNFQDKETFVYNVLVTNDENCTVKLNMIDNVLVTIELETNGDYYLNMLKDRVIENKIAAFLQTPLT